MNTKAKNVIIYENKIARQKLDYFTFNNIKGRSGRMFEHFVGRVFKFDEEPQQELPFVDFPLYTQDEDTPESLLIQLDFDDLNDSAKERVTRRATNSPLPIEILRENHGFDTETQVSIFNKINNNIHQMNSYLSWTRIPKYDQLEKCCELIWDYFVQRAKNGVYSYKQLTLKIWQLQEKLSIKDRIAYELQGEYAAKTANEAVERVLGFDRNWAGFDFPQMLMALSRIQEYAFRNKGLMPGNYSFFTKQVESLFLPEIYTYLDEFGIPINLSQKCDFLRSADNLPIAIKRLKSINIESLSLHEYEKVLLKHAKESL